MKKLTVLLAVVLACGLAACDSSDPNSPAFKRKQAFKMVVRYAEPLGKVARGRDPYHADNFIEQTAELQRVADKPWEFFTPPQPGDTEKTRAKPEIWAQPQKFEQLRKDFIAAVDGVAAAAQTRDFDQVRPAVEKLEKTCMACHKAFRAE